MGAINGASTGKRGRKGKSSGKAARPSGPKGKKGKGNGGGGNVILTVIGAIVLVLVTVLVMTAVWKMYLGPKTYNEAVASTKVGQTQTYIATRDIQSGELVDGAIKRVDIPSTLAVSNALPSGANTSELRASTPIMANSIVTVNNTYEPEKQDVTLNGSRLIAVDYLDTKNVEIGDYVDIRIKRYTDASTNSYSDDVVCSKKMIIDKKSNGDVILNMSEADILNLNTAVVETALKKTNNEVRSTVELYVAVYVDPANQTKAQVTYSGKGINYTSAELAEAEQLIKYMNTGEGTVYDGPEVDLPAVQ